MLNDYCKTEIQCKINNKKAKKNSLTVSWPVVIVTLSSRVAAIKTIKAAIGR